MLDIATDTKHGTFQQFPFSRLRYPGAPSSVQGQYTGAGHQNGVDARRMRELQDLSARMQALHGEMTGLRDGYQSSDRRSSMPAMSPSAMHPNGQNMPFMNSLRPGSPFQPSANVLNATSAAQAAMHGQGYPQHGVSPPNVNMDLDLDGLLRDGRQARARSASMPVSPGPFSQNTSSDRPAYQPAPQPFDMPMPPAGFTPPYARPPSPMAMPNSHHANYDGLGMGARPMSPPFGYQDTPHHIPRTVPDVDMNGFQRMSFGAGMSPPDPMNIMGSASPSNGMPYPQTAHQQFQARPQSAFTTDAFGGQAYQFPNPFASAGQATHHSHPAYQAGFSMHQMPGMGTMGGFDSGLAAAGMHGRRPLSPRPAFGF